MIQNESPLKYHNPSKNRPLSFTWVIGGLNEWFIYFLIDWYFCIAVSFHINYIVYAFWSVLDERAYVKD